MSTTLMPARARLASSMTSRLEAPGRVRSNRITSTLDALAARRYSIATAPSPVSITEKPLRRSIFDSERRRVSSSSTTSTVAVEGTWSGKVEVLFFWPVGAREENMKRRPVTGSAHYVDRATVCADNALHHCEPQTPTRELCTIERIKNPGSFLLRQSPAGI